MIRRTSRAVLGLLVGGAACGAAHAERPELGAVLDVQQIAEAQFSGEGTDDVTYTEITGTIAGQIKNRRIIASGTYRLSYRLPEMGDIGKSFAQDGVLRVQGNVIEEWLTVDAGAIVTRSRIDPSGAAPQTNSGSAKNLAQTYSVFFQPSFAHRFGDLSTGASYRYAYTKNEGSSGAATANGPPTDRFDSATNQEASLSLGMAQSDLPFDWQLSASHRMEDASNLAKHSRATSLIGEVKLPIGGTVALVGSAGYERTRVSERRALLDPLTGLPVLADSGKFVVDPASPRILTYDVAGLIADGGLIWRPSRRSRFELRAGYRYGGLSVTGLIELKPSERSGLTLAITDRIESFGEGVSGGLANSGPELDLDQLDPESSYQDCLFGKSSGSGRCLGGSLGQASARSYRDRAVNVIVTRQMRKWTFSGSLGYSRRTYIDDPGSPVSLAGIVDQSFFGNSTFGTQLTRTSGLSFSFNGNLFKNGQVGASDVLAGSFSSNYFRSFGRNIQLQANLSVDASKQDGSTADISGRAQLGLQYKF